MSAANKAEALKQLQRNFQGGANLDKEVLESVLEMFNNNVKEATTFLQSQNQNDYIDPGPQNVCIIESSFVQFLIALSLLGTWRRPSC